MNEQNTKRVFDLEERTAKFSGEVIAFTRKIPRSIPNIEILKQLVRASCSVGANYIEANEALGKKDFLMRIRISRKEAKEARYWLRLVETNGQEQAEKKNGLISEVTELMNIFGSIVRKMEAKDRP
jgi:four helix bundle protein